MKIEKKVLQPMTLQRSRNMSAIKSKNTKPELRLRSSLWAAGLRYRINYKDLPGKPDIVIKKYRLIIFVDGTFWHGFEWKENKHRIGNNKEFWFEKIERNMQRDEENNKKLENAGYKVFRFWDFELNKRLGLCVKEIVDFVELRRRFNFQEN